MERVFGREDFRCWLDLQARAIFGIGAEQFLIDYQNGRFAGRPVADDLASVMPLLKEGEG